MVVYDSGRTKLVLFSHIEFYTPGADAATVLSGEPVGDNSTMECIARVLDRDAIARSLGIGVEVTYLLLCCVVCGMIVWCACGTVVAIACGAVWDGHAAAVLPNTVASSGDEEGEGGYCCHCG